MAELIEMPFGLRTQVGPRNRVLDVDEPPPPYGKGQFSIGIHCSHLWKTAETIEMPFGLWAQMSTGIMH